MSRIFVRVLPWLLTAPLLLGQTPGSQSAAAASLQPPPLLSTTGIEGRLFDRGAFGRVLACHDPIWTMAPDDWFDGAPMGNGDLGAMVWCHGDRLILTIDKTDLQETRSSFHPDPKKYTWANYRRILAQKAAMHTEQSTATEMRDFQRPRRAPMGLLGPNDVEPPYVTRLPLGRLEIPFTGKLESYTMRLHLAEARLEGTLKTTAGTMSWSFYVHASQPLMVFQWRTNGAIEVHPRVRLTVDADSYAPAVRDELRTWGYAAPARERIGAVESATEEMPAGGEYNVSTTERDTGGNHTLYLTISDTLDSHGAKSQSVARFAQFEPDDTLLASHLRWWRNYYPASFLTIPDTRLEGLYWFQMYQLGSGTRPDKLPLALEGPWTADDGAMPRFAGSYYWNIDTEMTYWPIYTANRLDFGNALYGMIDRTRPKLRQFCRQFFGVDGEFLRIGTDQFGNSTYMSPTVVVEFNGLPWVSQLYWLNYQFSQDTGFLRDRTVPLMKAALAVYLSQLTKGADGKLHLPLSESPEYSVPGHARWGPDATIDLSLIRALCTHLLDADRILGTHDPSAPVWQRTLDELTPYALDQDGGLAVRAGLPLLTSHRHHSHLMPIYPLRLINLDTDRDLVERSIQHWKYCGTGEWTGWSYGWGASIAAYTGQPYLARTLLLDYVDHFISSSGMHMDGVRHNSYMTIWKEHQVLTLEAGFGAANAIQDMLLQSDHGVIRPFAGCPWSAAAFWSLRAEGAFLVSGRRDADQLQFVAVKSLKGGPCRVLLPDDAADLRVTTSDGGTKPATFDGRLIAFDTAPGETVLIGLPGVKPRIVPLQPTEADCHFLGTKQPEPARWQVP